MPGHHPSPDLRPLEPHGTGQECILRPEQPDGQCPAEHPAAPRGAHRTGVLRAPSEEINIVKGNDFRRSLSVLSEILRVGATLAVARNLTGMSCWYVLPSIKSVISSETKWSREIYALLRGFSANRCVDPSTRYRSLRMTGRGRLYALYTAQMSIRCGRPRGSPLRDQLQKKNGPKAVLLIHARTGTSRRRCRSLRPASEPLPASTGDPHPGWGNKYHTRWWCGPW